MSDPVSKTVTKVAKDVNTGLTDAGRGLNRRVEFAIVANDKMIEDAKKEAGK